MEVVLLATAFRQWWWIVVVVVVVAGGGIGGGGGAAAVAVVIVGWNEITCLIKKFKNYLYNKLQKHLFVFESICIIILKSNV